MSQYVPRALGWRRDLPDPRDLLSHHEQTAAMLARLEESAPPPDRVDWREFCPSACDQLGLASSSAHAIAAMAASFERRATGQLPELSKLFVYQAVRRLTGGTGDCGAALRDTVKALVRYGAPPESLWPYDPARLDQAPDPYLFGFSRPLASISYVRLDAPRASGEAVLQTVKSFLAAGFVCAFGFAVPSAISSEPDIPFPRRSDSIRGGQAVLAMGYDDLRRVFSDKGALLVHNSWGADWGEAGHGWLPYAFVREGLAADFWTLLRPDWLAAGEWTRPR